MKIIYPAIEFSVEDRQTICKVIDILTKINNLEEDMCGRDVFSEEIECASKAIQELHDLFSAMNELGLVNYILEDNRIVFEG